MRSLRGFEECHHVAVLAHVRPHEGRAGQGGREGLAGGGVRVAEGEGGGAAGVEGAGEGGADAVGGACGGRPLVKRGMGVWFCGRVERREREMSIRDWGRGGTGGIVGPGPWVRVLRAGCMVYPAWVVCLGGFLLMREVLTQCEREATHRLSRQPCPRDWHGSMGQGCKANPTGTRMTWRVANVVMMLPCVDPAELPACVLESLYPRIEVHNTRNEPICAPSQIQQVKGSRRR